MLRGSPGQCSGRGAARCSLRASNITAIADAGQAPETLTYSYDQLNRLTGMKSGATTLASYTYTQVGNLGYKSDESSPGYLITYPAPGPNSVRPHAAQSVFGGAFSFAYDADGNMTSSLANGSSLSNFGYDGDNHLVSRTGGNVAYTYDGNGTLVKRTDTSTGAWTVYIGGIYEVTNTGTVTKYYSALGRTVAMYWLLSDHLGSNSVVADGIGLVVGSVKYGPYGGVRSATGSMPTDKLYTGQQQEPGDALGLYDYKARFYSTALGRFLGVDPASGNPKDPQSWNAYAYTRNNPLLYTDPLGERWDSDIEADEDRYQEQRFNEDLSEQQTASDWANVGNTTGNGGACVACDNLRALAAAGIVSPELARAADQAACGAACQGLRALAEAGQGADFYRDASGGASAEEAGYQPADLVADVSGLTDAFTLFDRSPDVGVRDRLVAAGFLALPVPADHIAESALTRWAARDLTENPEAWRAVGASVEPAARKGARGAGVSIQVTLEHTESGLRVVQHDVVDGAGKLVKHGIRLFGK